MIYLIILPSHLIFLIICLANMKCIILYFMGLRKTFYRPGWVLCSHSSSYYYLHMNIILFVITEDITNIQITVSVYVSRKLPTESAIKKIIGFNFFFVADLLQLIWGCL